MRSMTDIQRQTAAIALYSFSGGFADATSFMSYKTFTGHVTGNLILLAVAVAKGEWNGMIIRMLAIACFLAGTSLGFRIAVLRRSAVWLFAIQVVLLLAVAFLPAIDRAPTALGIIAFCCSLGLQNGVVTKALGVSVHSTFVSGDFTSLLKSSTPRDSALSRHSTQKPSTKRILVTLIVAFTLGAFVAGGVARWSPRAQPLLLLIPLCMAMLLRRPNECDVPGA